MLYALCNKQDEKGSSATDTKDDPALSTLRATPAGGTLRRLTATLKQRLLNKVHSHFFFCHIVSLQVTCYCHMFQRKKLQLIFCFKTLFPTKLNNCSINNNNFVLSVPQNSSKRSTIIVQSKTDIPNKKDNSQCTHKLSLSLLNMTLY